MTHGNPLSVQNRRPDSFLVTESLSRHTRPHLIGPFRTEDVDWSIWHSPDLPEQIMSQVPGCITREGRTMPDAIGPRVMSPNITVLACEVRLTVSLGSCRIRAKPSGQEPGKNRGKNPPCFSVSTGTGFPWDREPLQSGIQTLPGQCYTNTHTHTHIHAHTHTHTQACS